MAAKVFSLLWTGFQLAVFVLAHPGGRVALRRGRSNGNDAPALICLNGGTLHGLYPCMCGCHFGHCASADWRVHCTGLIPVMSYDNWHEAVLVRSPRHIRMGRTEYSTMLLQRGWVGAALPWDW